MSRHVPDIHDRANTTPFPASSSLLVLRTARGGAAKNGLQVDPVALAAIRPAPFAKRRDSLDELIDLGKNRFLTWIDKMVTRFISVNRPIGDRSWVHDSVNGRLAAATVSEPDSECAYRPANTLKTAQTKGVRAVDTRSLRIVS